jgi:glycosyltransferase involved in cell wall biosynthesis
MENGLLVQPGNIQELAASIQMLIDNKSLRENMGNAAYQKALLLDIDN